MVWHGLPLAALLALLLSGTAATTGLAQGRSGEEHGNSAAGGNGRSEENSSPGSGNDPSNARPRGNEAAGRANAQPPAGGRALSQQEVTAAARAGRVIPLETVLDAIRSRSSGKVIDVQLIELRSRLIYHTKVLETGGSVRVLRFYADGRGP